MVAEKGSRKVVMLKQTQIYAIMGLVLCGALALAGVEKDITFNLFWAYLLAVTGNFGAFVFGNIKENNKGETK